MAQRRMFSKSITSASQFLMMPQSSQNLYFHLGMNADDDGFCEHFTIMRMTDSKPDDLKILQAKNFVSVFDDRVLIISDWKENNYLRADRYTPSKYLAIYKEELARLSSGIPLVATGKDRLGKDRLGKDTNTAETSSQRDESLIRKSEKGKELYYERKNLAMLHYGNGLISCNNCGTEDIDVLAIDHINGGGSQHRKETNGKLYEWLMKNNYPEGFQILCHNCNIKKERVLKQDTNTSSALIPPIIEKFVLINPACKSYYSNKTQRQACQDLIDSYGFDEVINCVSNILPRTNGQSYFPTITTPVQLRDKWVALKSAVAKKKNTTVDIIN